MANTTDHDSEEWTQARQRVTTRREFGSHVVVYVVVNTAFILIWAVTGAGFFWPAWIAGCWGIGVALHAWDIFFRRAVTDADVEAELRRENGRK